MRVSKEQPRQARLEGMSNPNSAEMAHAALQQRTIDEVERLAGEYLSRM
jgi:hypothetical protein